MTYGAGCGSTTGTGCGRGSPPGIGCRGICPGIFPGSEIGSLCGGTFSPIADFGLLHDAYDNAQTAGLQVKVGNVLSSDTFYSDDEHANDGWNRMGVLCVEKYKKAYAILTGDEV